MVQDDEQLSGIARTELHVFRRSLPLRVQLQEVIRLMGDLSSLSCIDIGATNGMLIPGWLSNACNHSETRRDNTAG